MQTVDLHLMRHDVVLRKKFYTLVLQKCLTRSNHGGVSNINDYIREQFAQLKQSYPFLEITDNSGNTIIEGTIVMNATFNNVQLFDDYKIKIEILDSYPKKLPLVYETSGRIPKEFEHFLCEGALCLGVENDMWDKFLLNITYCKRSK